ncbi:MAG: hypothetical protein ABIJ92_04385 [Candidatus Aenigmatarchaeota archaeon]
MCNIIIRTIVALALMVLIVPAITNIAIADGTPCGLTVGNGNDIDRDFVAFLNKEGIRWLTIEEFVECYSQLIGPGSTMLSTTRGYGWGYIDVPFKFGDSVASIVNMEIMPGVRINMAWDQAVIFYKYANNHGMHILKKTENDREVPAWSGLIDEATVRQHVNGFEVSAQIPSDVLESDVAIIRMRDLKDAYLAENTDVIESYLIEKFDLDDDSEPYSDNRPNIFHRSGEVLLDSEMFFVYEGLEILNLIINDRWIGVRFPGSTYIHFINIGPRKVHDLNANFVETKTPNNTGGQISIPQDVIEKMTWIDSVYSDRMSPNPMLGFGNGEYLASSGIVSFAWVAWTNTDGNLQFYLNVLLNIDHQVTIETVSHYGGPDVWRAWSPNQTCTEVETGNGWCYIHCSQSESGPRICDYRQALDDAVAAFNGIDFFTNMKVIMYTVK